MIHIHLPRLVLSLSVVSAAIAVVGIAGLTFVHFKSSLSSSTTGGQLSNNRQDASTPTETQTTTSTAPSTDPTTSKTTGSTGSTQSSGSNGGQTQQSGGSSGGGSSGGGSSGGSGGSSGGSGGTRTCPAYPSFPNASCTGVPSGTSLTTYNGTLTTTSNGQVIDGLSITGDLKVVNTNVHVTNTRIFGRVNNQSSGLSITDSDIGPDTCQGSSPYNNLNGSGYTLTRSHVHNAGSDLIGIGGTGTIVITDSIINQACFYAGDHLDAAQFYSPGDVGIISITHSIVDARASNTSDKGNAAIFWADDPGSGSRLTVTQSYLAGGNYTASLYDAHAGSGVILDVNNNTFQAGSYTYGACSSSNTITFNGTEGLKFSNNKLSTGAAVSC